MIAIVRWTPRGAVLQASAARWEQVIAALGRSGKLGAGRAVTAALATADGPSHARRVSLDADIARLVLRAAPKEASDV